MFEIRGRKEIDGKEVEIYFYFKESCANVYKKVEYFLDGEKTTRNKKEVKEITKDAPKILGQNTYHWEPRWHAKDRRETEKYYGEQVEKWMNDKGFEIIEKEAVV